VVALISTTAFTEEADITDAVFGRKALQFTQGEPESVVPVRLWNGYWRPGLPVRGARVSAVLFGQRLNHWTVASAFPTLWLNPWANHELSETEPFSVITVAEDPEPIVEIPGQGSASMFGLPFSWPAELT
jgi:hypothetical protein